MMSERGKGVYDATFFEGLGVVRLRAEGVHRTTGYTVEWKQGPEDVVPPIFEIWQDPPSGISGDALTEFSVTVDYLANEQPLKLVVRDSDGDHDIAIRVAPLLPTAKT